MTMIRRRASILTVATALALAAGACSVVGEGGDGTQAAERVVLVTHDSFYLPDELVEQFEEETGLDLVLRASGDAGALTNRLALTAESPTGDVAFGVDNTFASRAVEEGVFAPYDADLPDGADQYVLEGIGDLLTPIDTGSVCVNVDETWFAEAGLEPPATLEELLSPAYENLFVVPGATTSSPGMAFLLSTIAEFGEEWPAYWTQLLANGAKITSGWSDAYQVDFTQGGGEGDRPIVLSYDTSPAFTVDEDGTTSTTRALLDTCFRQVEYAGVLRNAANPDGAGQVIDFLLSDDVQAALPDAMYVFPVSEQVDLPPTWERFAVQPESPYVVAPEEIAANRADWLREWNDAVSR